ncbi:hypothetical protein [Ekhidna sp. To15]|uniref:hypothetical protein n=1 Tax=Ekhidna sp. To15 TaxID=3395267 RepID=UPI003F51F831
MNPIDQFVYEQRLLHELQDMFDFASPAALRRSIEDVYFNLIMAEDETVINKELSQHIYLMINFLNEVEGMKK